MTVAIAPEPCGHCGHPLPSNGKATRRAEVFMPETRATIEALIESKKDDLTAISHFMHENPELAWKEEQACKRMSSYLESEGFEVYNYAPEGMPTAWRVEWSHGSGGRTFGLNSEMDALPDIGHACGHNLIAICGVGAFLALREAMIKHDIPGRIVLVGTPAEEGDGGKVKLLEVGAYEGMGACMMLHPGRGEPGTGAVMASLAYQPINVVFKGKPAHAGAMPWEGINALDAATLAYASISALRQQLKPDTRVQGVITRGGGTAPNVIPPLTEMNYLVRAPTAADLEVVRDKVLKCFEGAATVSGCSVEIKLGILVKELRNDEALSNEFASAMAEMYDHKFAVTVDEHMGASTDFGNVTQTLPSSHPMYSIPAPPGAANHTPEFTACAKTPEAHDLTFKAMAGMAVAGLRFLADAEFADEVKTSWEKKMASLKVAKDGFGSDYKA